MNPFLKNKVDVKSLSPEEEKAFRLFGKLPKNLPTKVQERKYFDSGDYALSKAGKAENVTVGSIHPVPEQIPHPNPSRGNGNSGNSGSASPPGMAGSASGTGGLKINPAGGQLPHNAQATSPTRDNVHHSPLNEQVQPHHQLQQQQNAPEQPQADSSGHEAQGIPIRS